VESDDAVMEHRNNLWNAVYSNCYLLVKLWATVSFLVHQIYSISTGATEVRGEDQYKLWIMKKQKKQHKNSLLAK
jgi:hypothetical protein